MFEPFGEVGGDVPEYFSSRTHLAKIEDKKVIAKKFVLKLNSWRLEDKMNTHHLIYALFLTKSNFSILNNYLLPI